MTHTLHFPLKSPLRTTVIVLVTVFCGLGVAILPTRDLVFLLGVTVSGVLFTISPLTMLVFLAILSPLRTLIATEAPVNLPLDVGQLLVVALGASWIIRRVATRQPLLPERWSSVYVPLIAFVVIGGFTGFVAWSNGTWLTEWLKWVLVLLIAILMVEMGRHNWQWILLALVLAGAANAIIGLFIFFGGSGADHLLISERFFRAFGTFGQPNPFGGFMGLLTPLSLAATWGYAIIVWQRWQRQHTIDRNSLLIAALYSICSALMAAALVASWSRGAWLSFAASTIVLGIALPRKRWLSITIAISISLAGAAVWTVGWVPASIADRVSSTTQELFAFNDVRAVDITSENFAVVERLAHWQAAVNMVTDHPWLGVGLGNYEIAYERYRLINWTEPLGHAHNYYLNILAEGGIIGFAAYAAMWIMIVRSTLRVRHHPDPLLHAISAGLIATWSYLLIHSLTDNLYVNNMFLHLGIMLGLLAMIERQTRHYQWTEGLR